MENLIQLLAALVGSLGFALLFGVPRRYLVFCAVGGMLAWGIYLLMEQWLHMSFLSCLTSAGFAVVYAELMARLLKIPATLFVITTIIPLVPGGTLYYAMSYAVRGDLAQARYFGTQTLLAGLAIAAGISFVIAFRELRTKR